MVDAVRCAIEVQNGMVERNSGLPPDRRIEFRVGIHLGDVVEESDGDLMGDGVNIAARLEGIAEPGAICLSEQAYWQVKGRLDLAVHDLGPTQLKNIAEPIRVYSLEVGQPAQAKPAPAPATEKSIPPRLSIVVLPFANIGGDPEQEHFVDGVTESLTTDLSRIRHAIVIGRNTAFTYKGKHVDLKQIGRELNVRYVLEGSVQRGGNRMRVNVQLIDAETGNHLWAERFDKPLADLFDMQDEIVARLAGALNAQLVAAEARRAEQAPNPNSMDLYFQGLAWVNKGPTPDNLAQARSFYDRALTADPDNVEALIGSAVANLVEGAFSFVTEPMAAFAAAEAKLTKALSSVPDHAHGHMWLGVVEILTRRAARRRGLGGDGSDLRAACSGVLLPRLVPGTQRAPGSSPERRAGHGPAPRTPSRIARASPCIAPCLLSAPHPGCVSRCEEMRIKPPADPRRRGLRKGILLFVSVSVSIPALGPDAGTRREQLNMGRSTGIDIDRSYAKLCFATQSGRCGSRPWRWHWISVDRWRSLWVFVLIELCERNPRPTDEQPQE